MNKKDMWREFCIMIERCGCARAGMEITKELVAEWERREYVRKGSIEPKKAECTPDRCFPALYTYLHQKNAKKPQSHLIRKFEVIG